MDLKFDPYRCRSGSDFSYHHVRKCFDIKFILAKFGTQSISCTLQFKNKGYQYSGIKANIPGRIVLYMHNLHALQIIL